MHPVVYTYIHVQKRDTMHQRHTNTLIYVYTFIHIHLYTNTLIYIYTYINIHFYKYTLAYISCTLLYTLIYMYRKETR